MHDSLTIALLQAREAAMAYFRPIVKRHNLTEQQWRIVRILAERPSMDFHDLAFRACILGPSLTGILTRMERDGLVLRLKPVNDQRKLYVSLTPAGTALYESAQAEVEETYRLLEAQLGFKKVVLVIGGAYGVDDSVRARANTVWSLSDLVFPHQLVRLIITEQIYRAGEIAAGRPYHHV